MNIFQRINEVRKSVAYVQKDATVQNYRAVTHDMVTAVLRDELVKHGIIIMPSIQDSSIDDIGQTSKGAQIIRYSAKYRVFFINVDDSKDQFYIDIEAHANDSGDKAPGKAISYAQKYALLKVFALETGENEESRVEGDRQKEALMAHALKEVDEYMESDDALGIYLLSQSMDEAWIDIFNAGKDGQKQKRKAALRELESVGAGIYKDINKAILSGDALAAKENIEDIQPTVKRLLAAKLGGEKSHKLGEMLKQLEG